MISVNKYKNFGKTIDLVGPIGLDGPALVHTVAIHIVQLNFNLIRVTHDYNGFVFCRNGRVSQ